MTSTAREVPENSVSASPGAPDGAVEPARFTFRCLERKFDAWVQDDGFGPSVYVSCNVGVLPYSAENRDARRSALLLLSRAGTVARSRLVLTDFHRISVVTREKLDDPTDSVAILASTAAAIFHGRPLVELAASCLDYSGTVAGD